MLNNSLFVFSVSEILFIYSFSLQTHAAVAMQNVERNANVGTIVSVHKEKATTADALRNPRNKSTSHVDF